MKKYQFIAIFNILLAIAVLLLMVVVQQGKALGDGLKGCLLAVAIIGMIIGLSSALVSNHYDK